MANPLSGFLDALLAPTQALSGAEKLAGTVAAIARAVTDGKMWRSLGWLLLGLLLMGIGLFMLIKPYMSKAAGDLGGVAELAALA